MATSSDRLKGIVPVLLAPLTENREPDPEGIARLVDFLVEAGVGGLWALGSASEDVNLSRAHRLAVAEATARANRGRVPLILGTGLTAMHDILDFFDSVADLDLAGIHILPYDIKMGESRLIHFFTSLADRAPAPVWLYHNPKRGRLITNAVIGEVKQHPNIGGIKVGGYNLTEMLSAMMHRSDDFDVIGAGSGQLFSMLSLGAEAHTTSDASAIPEPFVELHRLFEQGELAEARRLQFELIRLSRRFPRNDNGEYAAEEKYILSLRGICGDQVNPLYKRLSTDQQQQLREALRDYGFGWA